MRNAILVFLLLVTAVSLPADSARVSALNRAKKNSTQTEARFDTNFEKATFALYVRYQREKPADNGDMFDTEFQCTATIIAETDSGYVLLTAGHCIAPEREAPASLKYYVAEEKDIDPVLQRVTVLKHARTPRYDYAVLLLRSPRTYPAIPVDFGALPPVRTPILNVNFSFGITKQVVAGAIGSGITPRGAAENCKNCDGHYLAEIGVAPGASGSAVVDEETHKIIGVVTGVFPGYAIGTTVEPIGQNFSDFLVDDAVSEIAPAPVSPYVHETVSPKPSSQLRQLRQAALTITMTLLGIIVGALVGFFFLDTL